MVVLNLSVGLELHFICIQDSCELILEGQQVANPRPVLKCPKCGFRIRVSSAAAGPAISPGPTKMPPVQPKRF